jgi:hypothetical protein
LFVQISKLLISITLCVLPMAIHAQIQAGLVYRPLLDKRYGNTALNHGIELRFNVPLKNNYSMNCGIGYEDQNYSLSPLGYNIGWDVPVKYQTRLNKIAYSIQKTSKNNKQHEFKAQLGIGLNQTTYAKTTYLYGKPAIGTKKYLHSAILFGGLGLDIKIIQRVVMQLEPSLFYPFFSSRYTIYTSDLLRFSMSVGAAWVFNKGQTQN